MKGRNAAFTLIELLIVVAIIAILAAIAVPNFLEAQVRAKVSRCKADMRSTVTAIESYAVDNNTYPLYGVVLPSDAIQMPAMGVSAKHEFAHPHMTTPIAYITSQFEDPFATKLIGPEPVIRWYNYMNMPYHFSFPGHPLPQSERDKLLDQTGLWRLIACGPDGDRGYDAKFTNTIYDPTNGTVSDGDIVRTQKNPESQPRK